MFKTNEGSIDRVLRIALGLVLLALWGFTTIGGSWHAAFLIGIVPLATGLIGSCPLYSILGISTCPVKNA